MTNIQLIQEEPEFVNFCETFGVLMSSEYYPKVSAINGSLNTTHTFRQWAIEFESTYTRPSAISKYLDDVYAFGELKYNSWAN